MLVTPDLALTLCGVKVNILYDSALRLLQSTNI